MCPRWAARWRQTRATQESAARNAQFRSWEQTRRDATALVAHQTPALCDKCHRRALAAGDDEPAHFGQLLRFADLLGVRASAQLSATVRRALGGDVDGPTSTACAPAFSRQMQCSRNEPCKASTPTTGRALILRLWRGAGDEERRRARVQGAREAEDALTHAWRRERQRRTEERGALTAGGRWSNQVERLIGRTTTQTQTQNVRLGCGPPAAACSAHFVPELRARPRILKLWR